MAPGDPSNPPLPAGAAPKRAAVVPRARIWPDGEALPVEDHIHSLLRAAAGGTVNLFGPHGSGKTTALAHLATVLPRDAKVRLLDDPAPQELGGTPTGDLVVFTSIQRNDRSQRAALAMVPWGEDECIEYLLATHRSQCKSIMLRILAAEDRGMLDGSARLWHLVLERFAADQSLSSVAVALRQCIGAAMPEGEDRTAAAQWCLGALQAGEEEAHPAFREQPLLRHRPVHLLLAGEWIASALSDRRREFHLPASMPRELIREVARAVRQHPQARDRLAEMAGQPKHPERHALAASILVAADPAWRPAPGGQTILSDAWLAGAKWIGIDLRRAELARADLSRADLSQARLDQAQAPQAVFHQAKLHRASMARIQAAEADFGLADLSFAQAEGANFADADLQHAKLEGAMLKSTVWSRANLNGARLVGADLAFAVLEDVQLEEADMAGAILEGARLTNASLRGVRLRGASFRKAILEACDLEYIELPAADFRDGSLLGSNLTGSIMPAADFEKADLRQTGLAGIEWPGANLRDADLRGASFHMGSTRSGLVGSTIPSEGSRTGFYTDDFNDQDFKAPEEIRKANLCAADLRGAKIDGVDFYLVDLRGALYTPQQQKHLAKCGGDSPLAKLTF